VRVTTPPLSSPQERILQAAKQVFAASGYRGGSLNDVATLAGYTRAGLLHHYPSKEAMLLALLDLRDERLQTIDPSAERESFFTVVADLPALVRTVLEDRVLIQLAHALTAEASEPDHPAHAWAAARHAAIRRQLAAAITNSIDTGELPESVDPAALAAVTLAVVEGLEAQWLIDETVDPVRGADTFLRLLQAMRLR
jgi:AcrR family transcriptional regulator